MKNAIIYGDTESVKPEDRKGLIQTHEHTVVIQYESYIQVPSTYHFERSELNRERNDDDEQDQTSVPNAVSLDLTA